MESLGNYYHEHFNCDFRSIRFNCLISPREHNYNGSTDFASEIFHKAEKGQEYKICLKEDRDLSYAYIDDLIEGTFQILETPREKLTKSVYNINTLHFTPSQYIEKMKEIYPDIMVLYKPDLRDVIAQDWPFDFNDSAARNDWGWNPKYTTINSIISQMKIEMERNIKMKQKMLKINNLI